MMGGPRACGKSAPPIPARPDVRGCPSRHTEEATSVLRDVSTKAVHVADRAAESLGLRTRRGNVLWSFLDRFRRAPAVPAAAGDMLAAELAPLLALLDEIEHEAEEARRVATLRVQAGLGDVAEEVEAILASARAHAEDERADALRAAQRRADVLVKSTLEHAEAEADRVRSLAHERSAPLVAEVVAQVTSFGGESA